jgi:adenylate cyclase class 2
MLEVEMKFPVPDFTAVERRLTEWGARPCAARQDVDQYLNAPDRDFAKTDEALRLRCIGDANFLTYKGPKRDAQTKTRTELEIPLRDGSAAADEMFRLFQHLGYRPVRQVRKQRRVLELERDGFHLEACLDEVEHVGKFVELEIQAPEERLDAAREVLLRTAGELGLSASERRSYLELLLESGKV